MIRSGLFAAFSTIGSCAGVLAAQNPSEGCPPCASLYADDTLSYWQRRYEPNLRYNLDSLIFRALSDSERQLTNGLALYFELRGEKDPRTYFVNSPPPVITISVASVKFLDDLAIASAWLVERGYSVESIAYYTDVLKYRKAGDFATGRYPAPASALHIPSDALNDPRVDHISQNILKSAVVFILAHEIGHLVGRHSRAATLEDRVRYETEADLFATQLFRRIGVVPAGVPLFFLVNSHLSRHRGDYTSQQAWMTWVRDSATHPLSGRRLAALASELRRKPEEYVRSEPNAAQKVSAVLYAADQLEGMAPLIDDTLVQRHAAIVGRQIPLSQLRPRLPGKTWVPGN